MPLFLAPIGILIGKLLNLAAIGGLLGGLFSGAVGGVSTLVESSQEHGGVNQQVLEEVALGAVNGAVNGAIIGAVSNIIIGGVIFPAVGAALRALAPAVRTAVAAADDLIFGAGKQVVRGAATVADDLVGAGTKALYVVDDAATGASKIGITGNIGRRLPELQRQVGRNLKLFGSRLFPTASAARAAESAMHARFALQRVSSLPGNEWFRLSAMDKAFVLGQ